METETETETETEKQADSIQRSSDHSRTGEREAFGPERWNALQLVTMICSLLYHIDSLSGGQS